jgi:platelet-activating factor acetylhydrolase
MRRRSTPDLELSALDPDAPLAMASSSSPSPSPSPQPQPQPKWLTNAYRPPPLRRLLTTSAAFLAAALRPRLTWKYTLCAVATLYALTCALRGVPLFASPLPEHTGPHAVGAVDLEIPLAEPQRVSNVTFKADGAPAFDLETVLFTVYYPIESPPAKSTRHYWIPKPVGVTAKGYAKFAHIDNFLLRPALTFFLWLVAGGITIPAAVDAPLLPGSQKLPVMVFSHGMASSRTDYTHFLGELAARGHVVAALEHRDGSSPGSLIRSSARPAADRAVYAFRASELQTPAADDAMDQVRMNIDQLAFRDAEIREAVAVLSRINAGQGEDVFAANSRREGAGLASWAGRLDLDRGLTIGGHSYGATGALQALRGAPSPDNPAVAGLVLDPGKSSGPLNHDVDVPLLVVHSTSWSAQTSVFYGRPHFDTVRDLTLGVLRRTHRRAAAWFLTGLGTSHPSVTDAPLLEPLLLSWTTGASADVHEALAQYVKVTADFFTFLHGPGKDEAVGVLDEEVTHDQYNHWVSEERKESYPADLAKFWQVHVSPRGPNPEPEDKDKEKLQ